MIVSHDLPTADFLRFFTPPNITPGSAQKTALFLERAQVQFKFSAPIQFFRARIKITLILTFEKNSIQMTIVARLTALIVGRYSSKIFKGPNKHSEDLINNFEQF